VALIRTMLNKKFKEKLGQLRGKSSYGSWIITDKNKLTLV
jgi:hypothetical protein